MDKLFIPENRDILPNLLEVCDYPTIKSLRVLNKLTNILCKTDHIKLKIENKRIEYLNNSINKKLFENLSARRKLVDLNDIYVYHSRELFDLNLFETLIEYIAMGEIELVDHMLKDFDVDFIGKDEQVVTVAIEREDLKLLDRLLKDQKLNLYRKTDKLMISAILTKNVNVVDRLLKDPRMDPSADSNKALGVSAEIGCLEIVDRLMKDPRVTPSDNGNRAFINAYKRKHKEVMNRLLQDSKVYELDQDATFRYHRQLERKSLLHHL